MNVPGRLRDEAINFCLVEKPIQGDKASGKIPFQKDWPNLNIKWDDEQLSSWLGMNGNYGVIGGGEKNLVIIDFDEEELQNIIEPQLPDTFTVKTGGGLHHKYYFTDGGKSFKILDEEGETRADIQSKGKQVVGPGSKHYTGNLYTIEHNHPIATMKFEDIKNLLMPHNKFVTGKSGSKTKTNPKPTPPGQKKIFSSADDFQDDLFRSVSFESLLSEFGVDTSKNPSNCPFHDSKGQKCLGWEDEQAHCFHCEGAWNKMSWIKDNKGCDAKEAIEWLAEREGRTDELEASREKWIMDKTREEMAEFAKKFSGDEDAKIEDFKEKQINWTDEDISWEDMKETTRKIIKDSEKMFMVCSHKDIIVGKPQLIHPTKQTITIVRLTEKTTGRKGEEETEQKIKFLDESGDKRSDGIVIKSWSELFWTYRVVSDNIEYYLLSSEELPIQSCTITGMKMQLTDVAEMNQSLKVSSLSNLFFVKSFEPSVKIVPKESLIKFTRDNKITEQRWFDFLDYHDYHTRNRFPFLSNMLRSAHLLSGKKYGWPLHVGVMGPAGTRKSMGYVETVAQKFEEEPSIIEGGNSRIKGLSPSFKEKPANIGYLAKCERMGFIDELGKMIEFESNKHDGQVSNVLGELNFLLDHKKRTVGSGNDNQCVVQANSKFLFVTNPVRKKRFIKDHVGTMDPTTMSRILWWIQDEKEQDFVLGPGGIEKVEENMVKDIDKVKDIELGVKDIDKVKDIELGVKDIDNKEIPPTLTNKVCGDGDGYTKQTNTHIYQCWGEKKGNNISLIPKYISLSNFDHPTDYKFKKKAPFTREDYLTFFDTINSFICEVDEKEVIRLSDLVTNLANGAMVDIWKPRGPHHVELIIDGFIKHRCLFRDYDASFKAKPEDYKLAETFLIEMVGRWDTDLSVKKVGWP